MPESGIYSTASDLFRFYQMMLNNGDYGGRRVLSPAAVELMTTVETGDLKTGFAPGVGYGLGWGDRKGRHWYVSLQFHRHLQSWRSLPYLRLCRSSSSWPTRLCGSFQQYSYNIRVTSF
jgi:CubicO group peptidase (beta-lactamase class C family)